GDACAKHAAEVGLALADMIQLVDSQPSVAFAVAPDNSPLTWIGIHASNAKLFHEGVKGLWEKWQKVIEETARNEAQTPGTHVQWKFKDSNEAYAGTTIQSFQ